MKETIKLLAIDYHRNGCSGRGFHVLIAQEGDSRKVIIRPDSEGTEAGGVECYVLDVDKLAQGDIAFASNSWRGDHYADFADQKIAESLHD